MKSWALPGRDVDQRDEAVEKRERCTGPGEGEGKDAEERGGP